MTTKNLFILACVFAAMAGFSHANAEDGGYPATQGTQVNDQGYPAEQGYETGSQPNAYPAQKGKPAQQ